MRVVQRTPNQVIAKFYRCKYFELCCMERDFKKKVWENKPHDIESLKQAIIKDSRDYSKEIIDIAIDSFRKRLRQIKKVDGGYIEHYKK